jgi:hypothetical protein
MQRLRLKEPFQPGVTKFEEGVHYNYTPGGHTLILSRRNPSLAEIYDVRKGPSLFALGLEQEVLVFMAKFGDWPWQVAHYNWWINPPIMRPDPMDDLHRCNGGLALNVCLVNASNGLVEALRAVRLSQDFGCFLLEAVELQTRHPFDPMHYLGVVEKASAEFHDDKRVVENAICLCSADFAFADHLKVRRPSVCH